MVDKEIIDLPDDSNGVIDSTSSLPLQKDAADTRRRTVNDVLSSPDNTMIYANGDEDTPLSSGVFYTSAVSTKQIVLKDVFISLKNTPTSDPIIVDVQKETGSNTGIFNSIFSTLPQIDVGEIENNILAILSDVIWEKGRRMQFVLIGFDSGLTASGLKTTFVIDSVFGIPRNWVDATYKRRRKIIINAGQVPSVQNNFPLLIKDQFGDMDFSLNDGILFTEGDDTTILPSYVINLGTINTNDATVKCLKPIMQAGESVYMYFDPVPSVGLPNDDPSSHDVFDSTYSVVYDLNREHGISPNFELDDETGNEQNLIAPAILLELGKIDQGVNFDGTINDVVKREIFNGFPTTKLSFEVWAKIPPVTGSIISYSANGKVREFEISNETNVINELIVYIGGIRINTLLDVTSTEFVHLVVQWESVTGLLTVFLNGDSVFSSNGNNANYILSDGGYLVLGQRQTVHGGSFVDSFLGVLEKLVLSNVIRSADLIKTTHNNDNDPSAFYTLGVEEKIQ